MVMIPGMGRPSRHKTPTVLQMEEVECGAACLCMVLGSFGRYVPLEQIRYECGVSRDGTKASKIIQAARRFGLKAKGFSVDNPEDLRDMSFPQIIFWNFNHFVVLEGFGRGTVYLNDPASGPRLISAEEFDQSFTGISLTFEPGPDFTKGGLRSSVRQGLVQRLRHSRLAFAFVVIASVLLVIPGLLAPAASQVFVDYYLVRGFHDWLQPLLFCVLGIALLRALITWLQSLYLLRLQTKLSISGSAQFFWHVLRLPMSFFAQRFGPEVVTRVWLNDRVAHLIAGDLATTLFNIATMLIYALVMVQYDPMLTALAVLFGSLNLLGFALVSRRLVDGSRRLLVDQSKLMGIVMQGLLMIESFKAAGTESLFFSRWAGHHAKVLNSEQILARHRLLLGMTPVILSMLGATVVLVVGGFRVMDGLITIGALVAFQALMINFSAPLVSLVALGGQVLEAGGEIVRLDDVLKHEIDKEFKLPPGKSAKPEPVLAPSAPVTPTSETASALEAVPLQPRHASATAIAQAAPATGQLAEIATVKLSGHLEMRDVVFGFSPTDDPLITELNLELRPGSRIALVGGSGSGKSTIGKLIAGLYRSWSGEILLDGIPIEKIPRTLLRNSVAMVDQDISLFEGTVSENISLWDPTMPHEWIIRAARDADIHEEISQRSAAYEFRVKEGGRNFSGGQRQRIEIARALATKPSLLILDEATSALDAVSEKRVIDNVRRRGCSCVIIAHRLSTIRDCDEIIMLDRGQVVERGTHAELFAARGGYRDLIEC